MGYSARRGFTSGSMRSTGAQRQAEMQQKIQLMQEAMTAAQDAVEAQEFTASVGGGVVEAAWEMVEGARALKAPVHISHLKAMGRDNWNRKIPQVLALLDRARQEGLDLSCDVYPYTAGSTQLLHILPPEFLAGGPAANDRCQQVPDLR